MVDWNNIYASTDQQINLANSDTQLANDAVQTFGDNSLTSQFTSQNANPSGATTQDFVSGNYWSGTSGLLGGMTQPSNSPLESIMNSQQAAAAPGNQDQKGFLSDWFDGFKSYIKTSDGNKAMLNGMAGSAQAVLSWLGQRRTAKMQGDNNLAQIKAKFDYEKQAKDAEVARASAMPKIARATRADADAAGQNVKAYKTPGLLSMGRV